MIKRFFNGMVFGTGFVFSALVILTLWSNYSFQSYTEMSYGPDIISVEPKVSKYPIINNFSDLSLDQKIEMATAILVTSIEKDESGEYRSTVAEILKKNDDVELYYNVGDVYDDHTDYSRYEDASFIPKGFIVFMTQNPATMTYSTSFSGARISGLGDITMERLRGKCQI